MSVIALHEGCCWGSGLIDRHSGLFASEGRSLRISDVLGIYRAGLMMAEQDNAMSAGGDRRGLEPPYAHEGRGSGDRRRGHELACIQGFVLAAVTSNRSRLITPPGGGAVLPRVRHDTAYREFQMRCWTKGRTDRKRAVKAMIDEVAGSG